MESVQLTVCENTEQDHPVPLALVGVKPRGKVSFTVTVPLVEPYGLKLETGMRVTGSQAAGEIANVALSQSDVGSALRSRLSS